MKRKSAVLALAVGFLTAASVQAVPITYQYTGNPFTNTVEPYTTSDFVTGTLTLAGPLAANTPFSDVAPISFRFSDGVQRISDMNALPVLTAFQVATGPTGAIVGWSINVHGHRGAIITHNYDRGTTDSAGRWGVGVGFNVRRPGVWTATASTRSQTRGPPYKVMTLTLMALGVAARQFKRVKI